MISKIHFSNDSNTLFMKDEMINQYISNILIRDQLCPKKNKKKDVKSFISLRRNKYNHHRIRSQ